MGTYVLEYVQTDPEDSPSPGCGHYAGEQSFASLDDALAAGRESVGHPVPATYFWPCCDWQRADTLVTMFRVAEQSDDGNETGEEWFE